MMQSPGKIAALFADLKIGARLAILLAMALLAMLMIAWLGAANNKRLADCVNLTYQAITRPLAAVAGARGAFNSLRTALYDLSQNFNTDEQNIRFRDQVARTLGNFEEDILLYQEILNEYGTRDPYEQEAVDFVHSQLIPLRLYVENIVQTGSQAGRGADAVLILRGDFLKTADDISYDLLALTRILEAQTSQANMYADTLRRYNDRLSLVISAFGALFLLIISGLIVKSITRPMNDLSLVAQSFAKGNLDVDIAYRANNEIGLVAESFRLAARDLAAYLSDKEAAEHAAFEADLAKGRAEAANQAMLSSIRYAATIQKSLRPPDSALARAFADHHVIWEPRDIVGGDMYWLKNYEGGSLLAVCDCTGHGTPGALLTMLVVTILEASVNADDCSDLAGLMVQLDQRLAGILNVKHSGAAGDGLAKLNDGCDIAILFAAPDGSVSVASSGIPVFFCNGRTVERIRGQQLRIGEGGLSDPAKVLLTHIAPGPDTKFHIASDGLYDQIGGPAGRPFGYTVFKDILLAHHTESQGKIAGHIWQAFEEYRGEEARRDDVELIGFTAKASVQV